MRAALKHGHIVREGEGKAQVKDADAKVKKVERQHPCPEWKRKAEAMTLEEVREERAKILKRMEERKEEKHKAFEKLRKVLQEARHREVERQASLARAQAAASCTQFTANQPTVGAQAAAACTQFSVNQPAVGAVGQVGQPQPFYTEWNAPMPYGMTNAQSSTQWNAPMPSYNMTNAQSSTAVSSDPSFLMQPHSSSPAQPLHSQAGYWNYQYAYGQYVNGYGSMYPHYSPGVPSGTQQSAYYYSAQNVAWGSGWPTGLPNNNAAAVATPFNAQPSTSRP